MTRAQIFRESTGVAARGYRPSVWIDHVYDIPAEFQIYYAGISLPRVYGRRFRLDEKQLPDTAQTAAFIPAIIDSLERYSFGKTLTSTHVIDGHTLRLFDVLASWGSGSSRQFAVSHGRDLSVHRARAACSLNNFWVRFNDDGTPLEFGPYVDQIGSMWAMKSQHVPKIAMFVKKLDGSVQLEGAYACLRPLMPSATVADSPVDYTLSRPPFGWLQLLELGEFDGTDFTAGVQLIVPGDAVDLDVGLARDRLGDSSGTTLACIVRTTANNLSTTFTTAYGFQFLHAIEFPYAPPTLDNALCGTIDPQIPAPIAARQLEGYQLTAQIMSGRKGFAAGECPAFEKEEIDHGTLSHICFYTGAVASPRWSANSRGYTQMRHVAPQWSSWDKSQFPYTVQSTGALTVDGTVVRNNELPNSKSSNGPIYDLLHYTEDGAALAEHYPSHAVATKAARVRAMAAGSHYEDVALRLGKPRADGKMVFNGKVINAVKLSFTPYDRNIYNFIGQPQQLAVGSTPTAVPGATPAQFVIAEASSAFDVTYWRHRETIPKPPNSNTFGVNEIYRGDFSDIRFPLPCDQKSYATFVGHRPVDEDIEKKVYLYYSSFLGNVSLFQPSAYTAPRGSIRDGVDNWRFGRSNHEINYIPVAPEDRFFPRAWTRLPIEPVGSVMPRAPLTGVYELVPFAVGDVPCVGNTFRFHGAGQWSAQQTISYKAYTVITSVDDEWQREGVDFFTGTDRYSVKPVRSARVAEIRVSEEWAMRADVVEIYCELGAVLQQAGPYQPDPPIDFYNANEAQIEAFINNTFERPDRPRGRIADTVVYVDGQEPSPVLSARLRYRTAMRAEMKCSVDTSDLTDYPYSMTESESTIIGSSVAGTSGTANVDGSNQTRESHHQYRNLAFTFNREQTEQLMNGQEVLAMHWQGETNPQLPAFADAGGFFLHAFKLQLELEDA